VVIAPTVLIAQTPERRTIPGNDVAVYNIAGVMRVEGGSGSDVSVEVTRGGADASKLTIQTGPVRGRETLRVIYPDRRIDVTAGAARTHTSRAGLATPGTVRTLQRMTQPTTVLRESLAARYQVERELGEGGMATVYLAHDVRHGRKVAIKVIRPDVAASLGTERFLAEIKLTASLQHPHILGLIDSGVVPSAETAEQLFYVMPYVDGETLRARLTRDGALPTGEAVSILVEVADALACAHGQGIIHRDIKPENILLGQGHAMVADFGIAKALDRSRGGPTITRTGATVGTPVYMAPEQLVGDPGVDPRADLYSLGVVAYEALTGARPFGATDVAGILAAALTQPAPSLSIPVPSSPPRLVQLVAELLTQAILLAGPVVMVKLLLMADVREPSVAVRV